MTQQEPSNTNSGLRSITSKGASLPRRTSIGFIGLPEEELSEANFPVIPEQEITHPDFTTQISLAQSSNSDGRDLPFRRHDFKSVVSVVAKEQVSDIGNLPNLFKRGKFKCIKTQSNFRKRICSQVIKAVVSIVLCVYS